MNTYFLIFPDEETAQQLLSELDIYVPPIGNNPGYYKQAGVGWGFDPIGTITKGGVYDEVTGDELVPPTVFEGWYANYAAYELPESLANYFLNPAPATPVRTFA